MRALVSVGSPWRTGETGEGVPSGIAWATQCDQSPGKFCIWGPRGTMAGHKGPLEEAWIDAQGGG